MAFFTAYFWKSSVFIGEKKVTTNEILTELLNYPMDGIEALATALHETEQALNAFSGDAAAYRALCEQTQAQFDRVKAIVQALFPDTDVITDYFDGDALPPEPTTETGIPASVTRPIFRRYFIFLNDMLRVRYVYADFLEQYYHTLGRFPNEEEKVQMYQKYCADHADPNLPRYKQFVSSTNMRLEYTTLTLEDGSHLLCKSYVFSSLGAFLYLDFFRGMRYQFVPRKCAHCGRYFLPESGKYAEFCNLPSPEDAGHTCRDIGPRRKYDEKCRTDPVWQTYNRAYKTHYARYMKKKMTVAEFEQWSAQAIVWRESALQNALSLTEYEQLIRQ